MPEGLALSPGGPWPNVALSRRIDTGFNDECDPDLVKCLTTIREIGLRTGLAFDDQMLDVDEALLERI